MKVTRIPGFPQTSLEKFQWLFNDISRQKFPNFHDNSECHKTENHRTTCYAWPPYTPYVHYWVLLKKSVKVFLFHLMNSISVNNTCKIHIYLPRWLVKTTSISEFNYFSMSDWSKIQWFFHDFVILSNFKNFSWNSMIFQWSWSRSEFQWFFKSCGNPGSHSSETWTQYVVQPTQCINHLSSWYGTTFRKKSRKLFIGRDLILIKLKPHVSLAGSSTNSLFECFCPPEGQKLPKHDKSK